MQFSSMTLAYPAPAPRGSAERTAAPAAAASSWRRLKQAQECRVEEGAGSGVWARGVGMSSSSVIVEAGR
jgi:hypothetical protein